MRAAIVLLALAACSSDAPPRLRVGAAAVLRHAMPELVAGQPVDVLYGASDRLLASQVDVLLVADRGLVGADARTFATTSLVLVGDPGAPHRFATLRDAGVIAIGDPAAVPAGRYAKRYLEQIGAWDAALPRLVLGGDVAGVLGLAQRGTADAAIVYAADVSDAAPLVLLDRATNGPTVELVAAPTSPTAATARFVTYLQSPPAQAVLARHGFGLVQ